jgi:hypothetical protein
LFLKEFTFITERYGILFILKDHYFGYKLTSNYVNVAKIYHKYKIFKTGVRKLEGGSVCGEPHNFISLVAPKGHKLALISKLLRRNTTSPILLYEN